MSNSPIDRQRCGACRHWKQFKTVRQTGMCEFPVPSSVTRKDEFMDASDGADCPCFERKEARDAPTL